MPHINYQRGDNFHRNSRKRYEYPWDERSRHINHFRYFRSKEAHCLRRVRQGGDPDFIDFPTATYHNDNGWYYD